MATEQIVKIDDRGRVTRSTRKRGKQKRNRKQAEMRKFCRKNLRNLTMSDKHFDYGVFKGARVLKAAKKEPFISLNEMETHQGGVKYPYDNRCHPAHTDRT